MPYLQEFAVIALVHLLAVASPGPDFAIVMKQSVRYGRQVALFTSLGIGTGILLHVTYSLIGIGILIASNELLFMLLKYIAALYFCYIAWHGIRAQPPQKLQQEKQIEENLPSPKSAFVTGFLINGLNVKATIFFVSLFSMVINPETPLVIKTGYGIYMAIATALWFSLLSYLLTTRKTREFIQSKGYWLERLMGLVLFLLAIELVLSELNAVG